MKNFLINIALFFSIVAVVDISLGKVFHYLQAGAGGRTGAEYYVCKEATEDIIIMGSSRASHHYVPEIISETMGMSCFNAGQDGNGIILQYGRWKMLSERYTPKLIIYDITPSFDIVENDNMAYVDRLKTFCNSSSIRDYLLSLYPMEKVKLLSQMYRYNYKFLEMSLDYIRKSDYGATKGYIPLHGRIGDRIINKPTKEKGPIANIDKVKLFYLEQLLIETNAKGTWVILVVSPSWKGGEYDLSAFSEVEIMAQKYGALFREFTNSVICNNPDLFEDSAHLNDNGAREFTNELLSRIMI